MEGTEIYEVWQDKWQSDVGMKLCALPSLRVALQRGYNNLENVVVFLCMAAFADKNGALYPSQETLQLVTGYGRPRIEKALEVTDDKGNKIVTSSQVPGPYGRTYTRYQFGKGWLTEDWLFSPFMVHGGAFSFLSAVQKKLYALLLIGFGQAPHGFFREVFSYPTLAEGEHPFSGMLRGGFGLGDFRHVHLGEIYDIIAERLSFSNRDIERELVAMREKGFLYWPSDILDGDSCSEYGMTDLDIEAGEHAFISLRPYPRGKKFIEHLAGFETRKRSIKERGKFRFSQDALQKMKAMEKPTLPDRHGREILQ